MDDINKVRVWEQEGSFFASVDDDEVPFVGMGNDDSSAVESLAQHLAHVVKVRGKVIDELRIKYNDPSSLPATVIE